MRNTLPYLTIARSIVGSSPHPGVSGRQQDQPGVAMPTKEELNALYVAAVDAAFEAQLAPGKEVTVAEQVIRGRKTRAFVGGEANLKEWFMRSSSFGSSIFTVYSDERLTYDDTMARVSALAHQMVTMGLRKGDRIAMCMRNLPEYMQAFMAAVSIGCVGRSAQLLLDERRAQVGALTLWREALSSLIRPGSQHWRHL